MLRSIITKSAVVVAALLLFASGASASEGGSCTEAKWSGVNTALRGGLSGRECFDTYLPSAGLLMLDVGIRNAASVEPRLEFLGSLCDGEPDERPFHYEARTANSLLLHVREAGSYQFCVAAQDPDQVLGEYRMVNGFAAARFSKDHANEHEPDPDPTPILGGSGCQASSSRLGGMALAKDHSNEHEPDPDPLVADPCAGGDWIPPALRELCLENTDDDVADVARCATAVAWGHRVSAELGNGWHDDGDWFTFQIDELATVRIESTGASDVVGGLYDGYGNRLRTDDDGGVGDNFRIVKTLGAGRYFIRVDGHQGAEGEYGLEVERLVP